MKSNISFEAIENNNFVSKEVFSDFVKSYGMPKTVCYPSCGYDSIPSLIFSNVEYYDLDKEVCAEFNKKGLSAKCVDVRNLHKTICDLIILFNPVLTVKEIFKVFIPKYVICNNLHKTADELFKNNEFEIVKQHVGDYFLFKRK